MSSHPYQRTKRPPKIKQACDCCHARKIRCDGEKPCNNCQVTVLDCTYLHVPKKKGPKGPSKRTPRAILKMQMQQQQQQQQQQGQEKHQTNQSPTISSSTYGKPSTPSRRSSIGHDNRQVLNTIEIDFDPSPLLTLEVAQKYVRSFFKHKYPITPILHKDNFYAALPSFRSSPDSYALVASLCAGVLTQVHPAAVSSAASPQSATSLDSVQQDFLTTDFFITEARRARQLRDYVEKPTLQDVQTSFFIFAGLFDCDRHNSAWFHLREAITLIQTLRLHEEETYAEMEEKEALYSRRTFWLLFITERAYALQRHRPLTLQRTIELPTTSPDDPDAAIISGFLDLVSLFQNFDDNFVSTWNTSSRIPNLPFTASDKAPISSTQLAALQSTLAHSIPEVSRRTEIQRADLSITRLWLSTMTWQLCVAKGLLSSSSRDESLSFRYPVTVARDLVFVSTGLTKQALEANGPGILEKIFDIGCSLSDVLRLRPYSHSSLSSPPTSSRQSFSFLPTAPSTMELTPRDYLHTILGLLSSPMNGSCKYAGLLAEKADGILAYSGGPRASVRGYEEGLEDVMAGDGGQRIGEVDRDDVGDYRDASANVDADDNANTHEKEGQNGNVSIAWPNEPAIFDLGVLGDVSMTWLGSLGMHADVSISPGFSPGFLDGGVDSNLDPMLVALDAGFPMAIPQMGGPMEMEMEMEYGYHVN